MRESRDFRSDVAARLKAIYGETIREEQIETFLRLFPERRAIPQPVEKWNQQDVILITYGDSLVKEGEKPLITLEKFLWHYLSNFACVHILPFFPYSSDDGFSVIDYEQVNPELGSWHHIHRIAEKFSLQVDLVINHVSQKSQWFQKYLRGEAPYSNYFIEVVPETDLSAVVRPRSLPLLTRFNTSRGERWLWTTFSSDQIDLNFANPDVLIDMTRILLTYIKHGARIIRLDAIAFLWKEIGTSCLHLPQTHAIVKLFRRIFDYLDARLILLTETNVPNRENLSYFGDNDEAHMVYQFSLPPLLLHTLYSGNATHLAQWAADLPHLPNENTFFNFTASHDGIGVRPLEGLLSFSEIDQLCASMENFGGRISRKTNSDGSTSPYEINISLFDAFKGTVDGIDEWQEQRFLCSQTIMMALKGIPAFYIHSLLATPNDEDGVRRTGQNRSINRRKWNLDDLLPLLHGETSHARIFNELRRLIALRQKEKLFHPNMPQEIIHFSNDLFIIRRHDESGANLYCISNITKKRLSIDLSRIAGLALPCQELIDGRLQREKELNLSPYQTVWLKFTREKG